MTGEERGGPRGEKLSRMSLRALTRLRRLVEDHLLTARLDAGGIPLELEEIPAREMFPGATAIGAGSLELELESGLSVVGDPSLARRVVEGVLLAAARGGADVRVTGIRKGKVARFCVYGAPAIPEDLSDPRRGDAGDTRGAALALPVARRACALLGGSIRPEDGRLDAGASRAGDAPAAGLGLPRPGYPELLTGGGPSATSPRSLNVFCKSSPAIRRGADQCEVETWLLVSWVARSA